MHTVRFSLHLIKSVGFFPIRNRIIPLLAIGCIGLLFSCVLINDPDIPVGSIVSKKHYFNITSAAFIVLAVWIVSGAGKEIRLNILDILLLLYGLYSLLNYLVRFPEYNEDLMVLCLSLASLFFYKQLILLKPEYKDAAVLGSLGVLLLFGTWQASTGQMQLLGWAESSSPNFTLTGSFNNPGPYAIYLSPVLVVSFAFLIFQTELRQTFPGPVRKYINLLCYTAACAAILVIPAADSRISLVGIAFGLSVLLFIRKYHKITTFARRNRLLSFAVTISVTTGITWLLYLYRPSSVVGRLKVWAAIWQGIKQRPWTGIGYNQLSKEFGRLNSEASPGIFFFEGADYVYYAFNDYLQILAENGIIGFTLFGSILFFCFKSAAHLPVKGSANPIAALAGLITSLVTAFTSYGFELVPAWLTFLFLVSVISLYSNLTVYTCRFNRSAAAWLLPGCISLCMFFIIHKELDIYSHKKIWRRAEELYSAGFYSLAEEEYRKVLPVYGHPDVVAALGKTYYMTGDYKNAKMNLEKAATRLWDPVLYRNLGDTYVKLSQFEKAEKMYKTAITIDPRKMYPRYVLAMFYKNRGDTIRAREIAETLVRMPDRIPTNASKQIRNEMQTLLK